jgi:hypothetical protein
LLSWSIVEGLIAAIEYQLVDAPNGVVPSFATRAVLVLLGPSIGFGALVLAIRYASSGASTPRRRPSILVLLGIVLFTLMAAGGSAASVWWPRATAEAVGAHLPVSALAEWGQQTIRLSILGFASKTTALISAFLYSAWKWRFASRSGPVLPS